MLQPLHFPPPAAAHPAQPPPPPPPPTASVKESNRAVVDIVVGGMAEGCSCRAQGLPLAACSCRQPSQSHTSLSAPAAAAATCSPPTGGALLRHVSNHSRRVGAVFSGKRRRRRREEEAQRIYGWRGGAASFRRADTAKVCNSVGIVSLDGAFECSSAVAATQGVSGRLRARQGLRHLLAAMSAFDATSRRHVSTQPR
jgi:hypothetical protein